ncbi:MAG: ice-binding family protein [bacterium]|nr:ice-binding family protein [bacterium]
MKKFNKVLTVILSIALILGMVESTSTFAATNPELGAARGFAVLAGSGIVSTNPPQVIVGDAGSSPTVTNGLTNAEVTGTNYKANEQAVIDAKIDLATAYTNASTQPQSGANIPTNLATQILSPGVYHSASGTFEISGGGVLTLNGGGDPNAVFIIKADTTLTTAVGSSVVLTNGARASNVFWTVGTSATLQGTTFVGTVMALASITDSGGSTVLGRLLADANNNGTGAVTLNNTTVTVPTSIILNKIVVNNDGGTAVESNWTLTAAGPTTISGPGAPGSTDVVSGNDFLAGTYALSESAGPAGYTASSWSCVVNGDAPVVGSSITLQTGDTATCTITNNDIAPATLRVIKTVVNNNGGVAVASDFNLHVKLSGTDVAGSPAVGLVSPGRSYSLLAGTYVVSEDANAGYLATFSGDCNSSGSVVLAAGESKTCTITNDDIAPEPEPEPAILNVIKTVVNDDGGTAVASNFTITVTGTNVSPSSFAGSEAGVEVTLDAGSYSVAETAGPSGYLASGSGDCSGTIAAGETKTCTIANNDIAPQIIVNKIVINDNGGTKVIADFPLFLNGDSIISGVATATTVGLHTVSETTDSGYTSVIGGDCAANGTITLVLGDVKTCTITNDDITPVVPPSSGGGGGGGSYSAPVPPLIDVVKVPSPLALSAGPGPVMYTYTLRNIGTVPVTDTTMVGDTCSPIIRVSGDTNNDNKLDVDETWVYTCSTTLSKTHTNIVTAIGWANNISVSDSASATVIVGLPIVPPLINVTKVPNQFVFSAGGGMVTYTYKVTNPGIAPLRNVRLTDDKCGSVEYVSGDTNSDSKLDSTETWTYTCQTNLAKTTVNIVTASGEANSLTARDSAIATVVVSSALAPKLPDTGVGPNERSASWSIAMFAGIFAVLATLFYRRIVSVINLN